MNRRLLKCAVPVLLLALCGCSIVDKRKAQYETSEPQKPLEVPPDLVSIDLEDDLVSSTEPVGGAVMLSDYARGETTKSGPRVQTKVSSVPNVGPELDQSIALARDGGRWWLEVPGEPGEWWVKVKQFWESQGLKLEKEEIETGIMRTEWREDRGSVPVTSLLKKAFSLLYSNSTRDQYTVRFESAVRSDFTEIHVAHRGMQQVIVDESVRWVPRPTDTTLEVEMLKRLALFVGASEGKSQELALDAGATQELAVVQFDDSSGVHLNVSAEFSRAWRLVGNALARLDVDLDDFDRAKGIFYASGELEVEPSEQGWFKRFIAGGTRLERMEFRATVVNVAGGTSRVEMQDSTGKAMDAKRAEAFLNRLRDELNQR